MRAIALMFLLSSGTMALAQQPAPGLPNPDQLFQLPLSPGLNQPQFKLEIPDGGRWVFTPRPRVLVRPPAPTFDPDVDPNMVLHPPEGSFADRQPRPAQPAKSYPNLKILPTEMAQLEPGPSPWPKARGIPIPITWPNAKFEPIPTTWENFRMVPVGTGRPLAPPKAGR